ncbi:MAG: hypothetical protein AAFP81_12370 [Pseudomonadota bacterium]
MNAGTANLINALVLIGVSAWAYFASGTASLTALIPGGFGLALFACTPGVRSENKVIAHIAVLLTLVVIIALIMPLRGALAREDTMALVRVGLMLAASVVAFVFFIRNFIDARKTKEL